MAEGKGGLGTYLRLQLAYGLEFAIWGCWSYAVGTFCSDNNIAQGWLYSAFALGALFAPVFGPIADKKFAAQKVFAFMQLICGASLFACHALAQKAAESGLAAKAVEGAPVSPGIAWIVMMFIAGLMFMPSIPLLNAILFKHIPNKDKASLVFIFGTIGWILVNLAIGKDKTFNFGNFYQLDGALAIFLALYALTLPNTPPEGAASGGDPFGFKAFKLFGKFQFFLFILCATLVGIFGSNYYFAFVGQCFPEKGVLNQFSELIFMALLAVAVAKCGLKWVLTLGMVAWGVRYLCFVSGDDKLALVGILCHGVAYAFLYTAAYMYGDKVAPKEMKASVQALIAFMLLGVAQFLSGVAADKMLQNFPADQASAPAVTAPAADVVAPEEEAAPTEALFSFASVAYAQDESIDQAVEGVKEAVADSAENVVENAAEAVDAAQEAVADAAEATQEAVADVVDNASETVSDAVESTQEAAADAVDAATETVSDAVEATQEAAADVVDAAQETVSEAVDSTQEAVADVVDDATEAVSDAVDATTEAVSGAVDSVTDALSDAAETVTEAVAGDAEGAATETTEATAEPAAKKSFIESLKTVWSQEQWAKYDWTKIWGIPAVFCLFWAVVFALLAKEPKAAEDEE